MNIQTEHLQEHTNNAFPLVNIDDFGKYLNYTSFQEVVHQIKQLSLERIIANEPIPEYHFQSTTEEVAKIA
ncbi:hypothetical protein U27_05661 [Candidatus Vecturithrix granuli]|uniref:Uncharacterized protein n=1 Tax=Vecturithrix granuli TaxID=1499967 RepID=A0A081C282_VECG1|nr:hypothetical protein U27_05661 [Candidatus Vecturithrix granuli]